MTVTASADAAPGLCFPTVVGTVMMDGQPLVRKAVPVETVVQAFYIKHWFPTKGCVLEVKEPAFFTISANIPPKQVLEVKQGGTVKVVVKAARRADGKFPVNLAVLPPSRLVPPPQDTPRPPPQPLTVTATSIPAGKDEAIVTITRDTVFDHSAQWTDTYANRAWEPPDPVGVFGTLPPVDGVDACGVGLSPLGTMSLTTLLEIQKRPARHYDESRRTIPCRDELPAGRSPAALGMGHVVGRDHRPLEDAKGCPPS